MKDKGLQVIGAGFGRSGTKSLKKALETLGYKPCYHFQVTLFHYSQLRFWIKAKAGKDVNYMKLFRKYRATVDWPACEFYKELMEVYPDAKVLLNIRDPEKWYDSMYNTIWAIQPVFRRSFLPAVYQFHKDIMWDARFEGEFENREKAIAIYRKHIEDVKEYVPADRLLVFDVKEGWGPLCAFLDRPVPPVPFPHLNDSRSFKRLIMLIKVMEWLIPVLAVSILTTLLAFLVF